MPKPEQKVTKQEILEALADGEFDIAPLDPEPFRAPELEPGNKRPAWMPKALWRMRPGQKKEVASANDSDDEVRRYKEDRRKPKKPTVKAILEEHDKEEGIPHPDAPPHMGGGPEPKRYAPDAPIKIVGNERPAGAKGEWREKPSEEESPALIVGALTEEKPKKRKDHRGDRAKTVLRQALVTPEPEELLARVADMRVEAETRVERACQKGKGRILTRWTPDNTWVADSEVNPGADADQSAVRRGEAIDREITNRRLKRLQDGTGVRSARERKLLTRAEQVLISRIVGDEDTPDRDR